LNHRSPGFISNRKTTSSDEYFKNESHVISFRGLCVKFKCFAAVIVAVAFASPAWPATLNVTGGEVFVDQGSGYRPVEAQTAVNAGDTVMAKFGGSAEVVYDDECRQTVDVGTVVVVAEKSPCALEPVADSPVYIVGGVLVAAGGGLILALPGDESKSASAQ
jgi:hypothetical protein